MKRILFFLIAATHFSATQASEDPLAPLDRFVFVLRHWKDVRENFFKTLGANLSAFASDRYSKDNLPVPSDAKEDVQRDVMKTRQQQAKDERLAEILMRACCFPEGTPQVQEILDKGFIYHGNWFRHLAAACYFGIRETVEVLLDHKADAQETDMRELYLDDDIFRKRSHSNDMWSCGNCIAVNPLGMTLAGATNGFRRWGDEWRDQSDHPLRNFSLSPERFAIIRGLLGAGAAASQTMGYISGGSYTPVGYLSTYFDQTPSEQNYAPQAIQLLGERGGLYSYLRTPFMVSSDEIAQLLAARDAAASKKAEEEKSVAQK